MRWGEDAEVLRALLRSPDGPTSPRGQQILWLRTPGSHHWGTGEDYTYYILRKSVENINSFLLEHMSAGLMKHGEASICKKSSSVCVNSELSPAVRPYDQKTFKKRAYNFLRIGGVFFLLQSCAADRGPPFGDLELELSFNCGFGRIPI